MTAATQRLAPFPSLLDDAGARHSCGTDQNNARCDSEGRSSPEGKRMSEQIYRGDGLAMPLLVTIIMGAIGVFIFFQFGS